MDTDTSEAIEALRDDIRRGDSSVRSDVGQLREDMFTMRNDLKRHTEVLFESLRDDIRIIAEGVVSLDAKTRSLDTKVERLDAKVERLDMKVERLDAKIESVDAKVESLLPPDRRQ